MKYSKPGLKRQSMRGLMDSQSCPADQLCDGAVIELVESRDVV